MNLSSLQALSIRLFEETTTGEVIKKTEDLIHHDTFRVVMLALIEVGTAWIISNMVKRWCEKVASKSLNKGVMTFLGSFLSIAIKTIGFVVALDQLGVSMNVIIGAMSGLGVGIALALKNNMSSVASGMQILLTKPFKVGDYISIGTNYGTVTAIELTFTTLLTNDNEEVIVPNNNFLTDNMVNYTGRESLRCVLDFPCSSTEIQYYLQRLADCAISCPLVLQDPLPVARVDHYESSGLADLKLIYYCDTSRYWDTYDQVTQAVSSLFRQEIPKTAPEQVTEPELPDDEMTAAQPEPTAAAQTSQIQKKAPSVKQSIKQIVNDILPIPLPNLPAQKPLKSSIQQLIRSAADKDRKEETKEQNQAVQNDPLQQVQSANSARNLMGTPEEQSGIVQSEAVYNAQSVSRPVPDSDQNLTASADNGNNLSAAGQTADAETERTEAGSAMSDPGQNQTGRTADPSGSLKLVRVKHRKHVRLHRKHNRKKCVQICE